MSVTGRLVPVTATEYDLLRALSANAGRVSTYPDFVIFEFETVQVIEMR